MPSINSGSSLATGLVFYGLDTGTGVVDLAGSRTANVIGSLGTASNAIFYNGVGNNYTGAESVWFASDTALRVGAPWSWACLYYQVAVPGGFAGVFGRTANNAASPPFCNWDFEVNAGTVYPSIDNTGNADTFGTAFTVANGNAYALAATVDSGGNCSFYVNGTQSGSSSLATPQSFTTNDAVIFGGRSSAGIANPITGYVAFGAFWNRALTTAEISTLNTSPWSIIVNLAQGSARLVAGTALAARSVLVPQGNASLVAGGTLAANLTIGLHLVMSSAALDGGLATLAASDKIYICSAFPTTYTAATSTLALGNKNFGATLSFGSPAAASPNGRKVTSNAVIDGTVTASGTVTWWAAVDSSTSTLLAAGIMLGSKPVTSGQLWTLDPIPIHLPNQ